MEEKTRTQTRSCEDRGRHWRGAATAKEGLEPPDAEEAGRIDSPLEPSKESWPCEDLNFRLLILNLGFWPPEPINNTFPLFLAVKLLVIGDDSPWKLIQKAAHR